MAANTSVITESAGTFKLRHALLVYDRYGSAWTTNHVPALVTVHEVAETEGRPVIGPGVEATDSFLRRLHKALHPERAREETVLHFLDPRVLGHCARGLLWHLPSHRRSMKFKTKDSVRRLSGRVFLQPHLVFLLRGHQLSVFAIHGKEARPTPDTKLFFAPYYNIHDNGVLCWGSAQHPSRVNPATIPDWENAFFDSPFTHLGYRQKFVDHSGGHRGLWTDMARARVARFPDECLVSTGRTLRDVIGGKSPSLTQ